MQIAGLHAAALFAFLAVWIQPAAADELADGRAIYMGQPSSATARIGREATVPAQRFGCFSCHGGDGLGGREGGFVAPAITRERLESATTKRPAYDLERFKRLIEAGVDASGRTIAPIMPRYELTPSALAAVYDFLSEVEQADRAGVSDREIVLGILHDPGEAEAGEIVRRSLQAALGRLSNPKVFGRSLAVRAYALDDPRIATDILAAVMPVVGAEHLAQSAARMRLPAIAPVRGTRGDEDASLIRDVQASWRAQWKALVAEAPAQAPLLYPPSMSETEAADFRRTIGFTRDRPLRRLDAWVQDREPGTALVLGGLAASIPHGRLPEKTTVLSTLDGSVGGVKAWLAAGASIVLADPRPVDRASNKVPDIDRSAEATLRIVLDVLARTGRDLTRTRFMTAFDNATIALPNWPRMNYGEFRLTGTDEVSLLRLPAAASKP